ncbi:transcription factor 7-like 1-A isoform X2 [Nerophis lumbriciformis]|uniref:transcription factor 7-like 1-A isoform X2 n=1 Tax=Nerophis lumbriciformis TaxID=546530 RepID=UPI002ADF4338|nr:transcription factor 7-like 1 isoform X2 [Nerophis lumbriciformis]
MNADKKEKGFLPSNNKLVKVHRGLQRDKDMSGFTANHLPPNAALPSRTAPPVYNTNPRPVGQSRGYNGFIPIQNSYVPLQNTFLQPNPMMALHSMHFVPMGHQNIQPLPQNIETRSHIPGQTNFVPEVMLPNGMKMCPVGLLNGELLYKVTAPSNFTPPLPPTVPKTKKKFKKVDEPYTEQTYVKKPLNAFMLFSKEHRQAVKERSTSMNIAVINETLGKMWHLLPEEEKAKYYVLAEKEKRLHSQQHPDWSCRHNYGKKRYNKRIRDLTTGSVQELTSELQDENGHVESEGEDSPASLTVDSPAEHLSIELTQTPKMQE